MKITLNKWEVADYLLKDDYANWTYAGANALAEFLLECEDGEDTELDVVEIRCTYQQHNSLLDWAEEYTGQDFMLNAFEKLGIWAHDIDDEDETIAQLRAYVQDRTVLIEFEDGIILHGF